MKRFTELVGYASKGITLSAGNRWRRNSNLSFQNSIIAGYNVGADFISGTETIATAGEFTNNIVHAYTTVFNTAAAISLSGSTNVISNTSNPDLFIGLGLAEDNSTNLTPFYSTANSTTYNFNNLFPRDISSTRGAVTDANYIQWNSGWVSFIPQIRQD